MLYLTLGSPSFSELSFIHANDCTLLKAHWFRHEEKVVKLFLIIVANLIVTQKLEEVL